LKRARDSARAAIAASEDAEAAEAARAELTAWEHEFLESVETRLETFGSAFADAAKGDLDEPLSRLQIMKLKEIEKKARGKSAARSYTGDRLHFGSAETRRGALKRRAPGRRANVRDINDDLPDPYTGGAPPDDPPDRAPERPAAGFKPVLIKGGKDET